jgi:hypothetical protein
MGYHTITLKSLNSSKMIFVMDTYFMNSKSTFEVFLNTDYLYYITQQKCRKLSNVNLYVERAVPYLRRLFTDSPLWRTGFDPWSGHVGFVVDKVALWQVFSEYFGFPRQFSFHQMLYTHLSSGAGTRGQIMAKANVPSGLSLTPPQETIMKS